MTSDLRTLGKAMRDAQRAYEAERSHENGKRMMAAVDAFDKALSEPPAALAGDARSEALAKLLWERFAPEHEVEWPPTHAAEYRSVAADVLALLFEPPAALAEIDEKPKKETMHMNEQINMHVEALTGLLRELCPNQTGDLLAKQVAATVRIAVLNAEQEAAVKAGTNDAGPQP